MGGGTRKLGPYFTTGALNHAPDQDNSPLINEWMMGMKKYVAYGIGAALVDTEIKVTDAELAQMNVEKGLMTLVDEERQAELLGHLQGHLVKAVHAKVLAQGEALKIVEVQREDLPSIGHLLQLLKSSPDRFLLFCDDLSFSHDDQHYKSLKAILDGGIEGRPDNVVFYATSNRRHLMPRDMIENERSTSISPSEATEEKVSLSDRFGLWLGFHPCTQDEYLAMIQGYCDANGIEIAADVLWAEAIEWQATRGSRSGRVAWQYFVDLAGRRGVKLTG